MPIRPSERAKYPSDWQHISRRIRERANQKCECTGQCGWVHGGICGAPNGKIIARWRHDPTEWLLLDDVVNFGDHREPVKVVLTVAHLNHNPADCRDENLLALCQRCHLNLDKHQHAISAANTRRARKAIGDLL